MANNVFDLTELRKPPPIEDKHVEGLVFPPVALAPDADLAREVPRVPLVADVLRLTAWTGTRPVTEHGHLHPADAEAAVAELGLAPDRLRLLWVVAVNTGLLQIMRGTAGRGPLSHQLPVEATLEFWDGVVMDVLDRAEEGLSGSAVVDEHLAETLATVYSVRTGVAAATLAKGILHSHEVACDPGAVELRRLAATLHAELDDALALLEYCGLVEQTTTGHFRLTPLGVWAVRRDLLREGHDAPTAAQVEVYSDYAAAELVEAMITGAVTPSVVAYWLERRAPEAAAHELVQVAASGTAGQRGAVGTILEELGPEAEVPVRKALDEPLMWRYAASWLHIRDLPAPPLNPDDHTWIAIDSLAALLYFADAPGAMGSFDVLEAGEELVRLVGEMASVEHPDTVAVLDLLAGHHGDQAVAKAARKAAMKARSMRAMAAGDASG
ncbi:hypothetical protein ACFXJ8_03405 [Nonomuraea sp. NPDC059194]|uniref:hypothetical protein n=1 Tax=Nonomuraea sp. NPDC059194 TaxID=3346764 RepID=UPI0036834370